MLKYTEKKSHLRPWRKSFLQIGSVHFCYRVNHLLAPDPDSPLLLKKLESLDSRFRGESEGDDEDDDEKMFAIVFQRLQFGLTGFPFFVVCLCYNHCLCNRNLASSPSSIIGFSGDFFFPELRSGNGLAREVDGDGEGGRLLGFMGSDRSQSDLIC
ncbi:hypothetical protein U1Q18_000718 [Sarracenia purpurea var. burkii]